MNRNVSDTFALPPALAAQGPASRLALPGLVGAQLLGTSLWFSSSAALPSLMRDWGLTRADAGVLVSAVQAGFILGTLLFALTNLADRFPAHRVFLVSALGGAGANALFALAAQGLPSALVFRFATGLMLAGIYPVGMKIVVSWAPRQVGQWLGWLVGALTLGTASPFLLAFLGAELDWRAVLLVASGMATAAGVLVAAIGSGPHLVPARKVELRMMFRVFAIPGYRRAALGYFGHMWELYPVWVLAPFLVGAGLAPWGLAEPRWVSLGAFAFIGLGAIGCAGGGMISRRAGSRRVAAVALAVSGTLCLLAPWLLRGSPWLYLSGLALWGIAVVADSPQFSALSAQACPPEYVATALTIQNSIGFAISILSIELTTRLWSDWGASVSWLLAPGPLLGLILLYWGGGGARPARD